MGLKSAPQAMQDAFAQMKRSSGKKLSLHKISGKYYVYEYAYGQKGGKTTVRTSYIGHITEDGKFLPKGDKRAATAQIRQTEKEKYDEREAIVLRNLSMNGRMSMAKLSKRIGMSVTGTRHFVKKMEEKYNIRYFAEVDTLKLGYLRYIALIKFEDKIPKIDEIKRAFEEDPHVAFVAMTKGTYDMIMIFYLQNTVSLTNFIYEWRSSKALPEYTAKWHITPLGMASGITLPLRKEVIDDLVSKEDSYGLTQIEKFVLKELVLEGNQNFEELDKRKGLSSGRSNYAFYKLEGSGVIERVTITIRPLGLKYNSIFVTQTNNYKDFIQDKEHLRDAIGFDISILNKYVFRGDIGVPDAIFCITPVFDEDRFYRTKEKLSTIPGTETEDMIIVNVVLGELCYRNFDPQYTRTWEMLLKKDNTVQKNRLDY